MNGIEIAEPLELGIRGDHEPEASHASFNNGFALFLRPRCGGVCWRNWSAIFFPQLPSLADSRNRFAKKKIRSGGAEEGAQFGNQVGSVFNVGLALAQASTCWDFLSGHLIVILTISNTSGRMPGCGSPARIFHEPRSLY